MKHIFAYTQAGDSLPPYISMVEQSNGVVLVTIRSPGGLNLATIEISAQIIQAMGQNITQFYKEAILTTEGVVHSRDECPFMYCDDKFPLKACSKICKYKVKQ